MAAAGILALGFAFLTPPFQFPDEHAHFARAYEISRGEFAGRPDPRLPSPVLAYIHRFPELAWNLKKPRFKPGAFVSDLSAGSVGDSTAWEPITDGPLQPQLRWGATAAQLYCSIVYLPASAGIWLATELRLPVLAMMYAARLMNVVCFLAALWASLRLAPDWRSLTAAIALMPMTLHQVAAISADQAAISVSLAGFALILRARAMPVSGRYLAVLFVLLPLWVMCKTSLWALPLLLLIPAGRFGGNWKRAAYLFAVILASFGGIVLWRWISRGAFEAIPAVGLAHGVDLRGNLHMLAGNPLSVLLHLTNLAGELPNVVRTFVSGFGWDRFSLPQWTCFAYLTIPLAAGCIGWIGKPFTAGERAILCAVAAGSAIGIYFMLFVVDGVSRDGRFSFRTAGVQGRYFIPCCFAGFLALQLRAVAMKARILVPMVVSAATLYTLACLALVVHHYYL